MQHYDVAIVGGGLVGASLAHALSGSNLRVILLDQQPAAQLYSPALDNRGLALSYISKQILEKIGVWSQLQDHAYPMQAVHVSMQGKFGFTKITADSLKIPSLGYVISASALGAALMQVPADISVMRPVSITDITPHRTSSRSRTPQASDVAGISCSINGNEQQLTASLLIAADGADSMVRKYVGIDVEQCDYQQTAIVCNVMLNATTTIAYERFTDLGILALLPFGDKRAKCVITVQNSDLDQLHINDDQKFLNILQQNFGFRLGRFKSITERKIFPVQSVQAQALTAPGVILLGNAANTLHPVAAQGFNLGLRDVWDLASLLQTNSLQKTVDLYAARRNTDQQRVREFTETLIAEPQWLQHSGILAAQLLPGIKNMVARRGIGSWI